MKKPRKDRYLRVKNDRGVASRPTPTVLDPGHSGILYSFTPWDITGLNQKLGTHLIGAVKDRHV